jgi:predicted transcriptional regulator
MQGEKTITVTVRMTPSVKAKLQAFAEAEHRTLSQYAMLALMQHIAEREAREAKKPAKK